MGKKSNKLKKALDVFPNPPPDADDGLMDDLLAQLDSRDETVAQESANVLNEMEMNKQAEQLGTTSKQDAKGRFKARQMRKAAALAQTYGADDPAAEARLEKEAKDEERDIKRVCDELNIEIHEINPDGHCLFSAVADQLRLLSILPAEQATYHTTRRAAGNYIYGHQDDFLPFLPSATGEDGFGALDAGLMSQAEFRKYCDTAGRPPVVIHNPRDPSTDDQVTDKRVVRISYHRRMYGLGEHYNSLRPRGTRSQISHALQNMLPAP
ncbi:hypothetical protein B0H14DRAFT_3850381 [Mycena olivaceomarginata]|nr:hypothetical protein B0H14DRAFT_3850381 [Mycena olivaceomarginata]